MVNTAKNENAMLRRLSYLMLFRYTFPDPAAVAVGTAVAASVPSFGGSTLGSDSAALCLSFSDLFGGGVGS